MFLCQLGEIGAGRVSGHDKGGERRAIENSEEGKKVGKETEPMVESCQVRFDWQPVVAEILRAVGNRTQRSTLRPFLNNILDT